MSIDVNNIDKLSDEELFKALKDSGLNVGPITSTTRSLYERRLKNHIEASSSASSLPVPTKAGADTTITSITSSTESPVAELNGSPKNSTTTTPKSSPSPKRAQSGCKL